MIKEEKKQLIYVLNKIDLIDINDVRKKANELDLFPYVLFSAKSREGIRDLRDRIKIEVKRSSVKKKGFKRAHVGIIGYPNTGKSSIINLLTGRKHSGTSAQAGFTKGMQKVKLSKGILIIDTPGVIAKGEDSNIKRSDLKKQAEIGVRTFDKVKNPEFIVSELMKEHPALLENFYRIGADGDAEILLEKLGRRNNFLKKGNVVDIDRTARLILREWQKGNIRMKK